MTSEADVAIVGAGVVGCAVARELARYRLSVCVVEKEADVGWGTSCRNSGVVHSGINYRPGTLRARLDVRGNELMAPLCRELRVPMQRIGKLTVAGCTAEIPELHRIREQGEANGVPGLELIGPGAMRRIQPGVEGVAALHSPSSGIVCPYSLTIALAENALRGGAAFRLESEVTGIHRGPGGFTLQTTSGDVSAPVVINAAGLGADRVAAMAGIDGYRHYPCRGEYYVLDRRLAGSVATLIYPAPRVDSPGLGIHLTPTVEGNILIGPSSEYVGEREDCATTRQVMASLREHGRELLPGLSMRDFIRSFAGVRPKQTPPEVGGNRDFVIEESPDCPGLINLIGIESPGLTASPAIAEMVREMVAVHLPLEADEGFVPERDASAVRFRDRPAEERAAMVADSPDYGEILCRCEEVTRGEVLEALERPFGSRTLAGLKYRTRVMMGRCQGGFCLPRIVALLQSEYGMAPEAITLRGAASPLLAGPLRKEPVHAESEA